VSAPGLSGGVFRGRSDSVLLPGPVGREVLSGAAILRLQAGHEACWRREPWGRCAVLRSPSSVLCSSLRVTGLAALDQAQRQGHLVDALALRGEEGRSTLRKAAGRGERPLIRGSPNGATRPFWVIAR
jgi:hypothetical protein